MKKSVISLMLSFLLALPAGAVGEGNIDGGGGVVGGATGHGSWSGGDDGIRVTVMKTSGSPAAPSFDIANKDWTGDCIGFVKRNKIQYKNQGYTLSEANVYMNFELPQDLKMPRIISTSGQPSIAAIKSYFTDEATVKYISQKSGIPYEELTGGEYKLLLEPIAYFTFRVDLSEPLVRYAMTATEVSLFDVQVHRKLAYWMGALTHQNQPLSLYLERSDLGIGRWTGGNPAGKLANIDILKYLGVGIVEFRLEPEDPVAPEPGDYKYYTDTDVITAVTLPNDTDQSIPPGGGTAIFEILGRKYEVPFVCPAGSKQLVWVRWHTPTLPQDLTIRVWCPAAKIEERNAISLNVTVSDLKEKEPPDPVYDGPGIGAGQYIPNFQLREQPRWGSRREVSWTEWQAEWKDFGDYGYWRFYKETTTAKLWASYTLKPNDRVKTDFKLLNGSYEMKSGYGVDIDCEVRVITSGGDLDAVTPVQHMVAVFPEFYYQNYNRFLEPENRYWLYTTWHFRKNPASYYSDRTHFTPLWYPDGMDYPVQLAIFDAWTPGGQLYATVDDSIYIDGGACLDDWYIRPY